jgi:hypothetical protein
LIQDLHPVRDRAHASRLTAGEIRDPPEVARN